MDKNLKKRVVFLWICFIVIILSVSYISCSISNKKRQARNAESTAIQAEFEKSLEDTFRAYPTIKRSKLSPGYVGIYVDRNAWKASSEKTQKEFIQEIYSLVRMSAITSGAIKDPITLSLYTDDREQIGVYGIDEN